MIWSSPIYRFRIPTDESDSDCDDLREIVIDVTGSAPPFTKPSDALKEVLTDVFSDANLKKIDNVLEFGAAKLKNIPFILKKGKTVCAVEFKELTENDFTKKNIKTCKKYGNKFQELLFPNPFIEDTKKFDLALLINVPPVMPVYAERLLLFDLLYKKVESGKYVLWVAQKEGSYKKIREEGKNKCGDGIWMGKGRYFKTFFKYHQVEDLDELMQLYGFKLIKRYSVPDDARLYEKTEYNLFSGLITPQKIEVIIPIELEIKNPEAPNPKIVRKTSRVKTITPNPKELSIENLYIEKIKSIPAGTDHAEGYHRIVSLAIARIFRGSLRNMTLKVDVDDGVKIIDTVFTNCADKGFFHNLKNKTECSYPIFEMKNISGDPANTEFDQLNGRLNDDRGHFGILVCRKADREANIYARCKTYRPNNSVLFLSDKDIFELLKLSSENSQAEINDYMDTKLKTLLF